MAGGVEDPRRDGIETDESEEVDDTGDGIADTFVCCGGGSPLVVTVGPALVVIALLLFPPAALGPIKFEIVGGCLIAGDIDFELGDVDVVDVVVHVDGILAAVDTGLTPFCVAVAA